MVGNECMTVLKLFPKNSNLCHKPSHNIERTSTSQTSTKLILYLYLFQNNFFTVDLRFQGSKLAKTHRFLLVDTKSLRDYKLNYGFLLILCPSWSCTIIQYMRFISLCKTFTYLNFQQKLFNIMCFTIKAWQSLQTYRDRQAMIMVNMALKSFSENSSEDFA